MAEICDSSMDDGPLRLLIACTGSVALLKIPALIDLLFSTVKRSLEIRLIHTEHSLHFFKLEDVDSRVEIFNDQHEWQMWNKRSDPVLHIELRKWAHILLISPLDANTLAKLSNGLADNLLTCVARAWDFSRPVYFAPAMNTAMYHHPITKIQIDSLKTFGYKEIPCIKKRLICGDTGLGAMAEIDSIVYTINCDEIILK